MTNLLIAILAVLSIRLHAAAPNHSDLLRDLKINPSSVKVSIETKEPRDEDEEVYSVLIDVNEPISLKGIKLPKNSQVIYEVPGGIHLISGYFSYGKIDGFKCSGELRFYSDRLCRCELGEGYKVSNKLELPAGLTVGVRNGKLFWFKATADTSIRYNAKSAVDEIKLKADTPYMVKNSKVVPFEKDNDSSFCGFVENDRG